jgi:hypothetical protein
MSTLAVGTIKSITSNIPPAFQDSGGTEKGQLVKAFVLFAGTSTIQNSFNVSSITDNGTGDFNVNFANALRDSGGTVTSHGAVCYSINGSVNSEHTVGYVNFINSTTIRLEAFVTYNSNLRADNSINSVIVTS